MEPGGWMGFVENLFQEKFNVECRSRNNIKKDMAYVVNIHEK